MERGYTAIELVLTLGVLTFLGLVALGMILLVVWAV